MYHGGSIILCVHVARQYHLMQGGRTALVFAAYHGHKEIINILLNAGAKPDIQDQVFIADTKL